MLVCHKAHMCWYSRHNLLLQDLGLAQTAATFTVSPTPLGALALQIYRLMCNSGYTTKDFASVFQFLQESGH